MLKFKVDSDLALWRSGAGPLVQRTWISQFNALSEAYAGKSAVVTSWFRDDISFHKNGFAVDFRTRIYSDEELNTLLEGASSLGIPVVSLYRGKPNQHIHCGDLMTRSTEGK
jgi:hypothetical protein